MKKNIKTIVDKLWNDSILEALNLAHSPRWIELDERNRRMCSNCGEVIEVVYELPRFCPNCNEEMKG